jgi:hypothetical protein
MDRDFLLKNLLDFRLPRFQINFPGLNGTIQAHTQR